MKLRLIFVLLLIALSPLCQGCPGILPGSRSYQPSNGEEEKILKSARRDVFPNDARAQIDQFHDQMVVWTGIIKRIDPTPENDGAFVNILIEHHYWDWVEDFGTQIQRAFLSPRGEGLFQCSVNSERSSPAAEKVGEMAIVYGTPDKVSDRGTVLLRCFGIRTFGKTYYATDVWDYGRDFLLKGDRKDFKVLRTPVFW